MIAGNFADEVTHSCVVVTEVMKCSYHADLHPHGPHILPLCTSAYLCFCILLVLRVLISLLRRAKRLNYCTDDLPPIAELFSNVDDDFFHRINSNSNHVLQPYLPDNNKLPYQLRTRHHDKSLIIKTNLLNDTDFIVRMLYKYSY